MKWDLLPLLGKGHLTQAAGSSSDAFAASEEPGIFLGFSRQRLDQMSGLLPLTPRTPEKAVQTPVVTAAGSPGLCCGKHHLHLKTPPRIVFCCSWGRCSEETVLSIKQAGFVFLGSCSPRSSHGSAPRTTAPCSAPFPSHQSPHPILMWRVNIISLKGDKANHAPPSPEVPGLAWVLEQQAVRTLDHRSLRRIRSLKENQADQLCPPAAS